MNWKQTYWGGGIQDAFGRREMQLTVKLAGIGASLVSRLPAEELIYAQFDGIVGEIVKTPVSRTVCFSVKDIQCDNQVGTNTTVSVK